MKSVFFTFKPEITAHLRKLAELDNCRLFRYSADDCLIIREFITTIFLFINLQL